MQNGEAMEIDFEPSEWHRLPSFALERIFSFLNPRDRASASIVCKSWAETYECPSFWKAPSLSFSKGNRSHPCFNPQSIVRRFGQYFRHLTILCRKERRRSHKFGHRRITEFFRMLLQAEVQLDSIQMPRLMVLSKISKDEPLAISEDVTNFLKTQTGLTDVDFTNGDSHTIPCLMILESLVAENVQHLRLQKFFHIAPELFSPLYSARYLAAINRFHDLRSLWLNYRYLSDDVMFNLAIHLEGHLESFGVLMERCPAITNFISGDSWLALKTKCPKMQVYLRLEMRSMQSSSVVNSRYISPQIPLTSIDCLLNDMWYGPVDSCVFDYFRQNFAATLTSALFELRGYHSLDVCSGVSELVRACPLLETLTMRVRTRVFRIQELFDSILGTLEIMNRASLKVFRVTFRGLNKEHRDTRIFLQSMYVPKFSEIGIQLKMKMKR